MEKIIDYAKRAVPEGYRSLLEDTCTLQGLINKTETPSPTQEIVDQGAVEEALGVVVEDLMSTAISKEIGSDILTSSNALVFLCVDPPKPSGRCARDYKTILDSCLLACIYDFHLEYAAEFFNQLLYYAYCNDCLNVVKEAMIDLIEDAMDTEEH